MPNDIEQKFELENLESFDPKAFEGNDEVPQEVCNFVLSVALIFNDFKDLLYVNTYLQKIKPNGDFRVNRKWGSYSGMTHHLSRYLIGLVREVIILVHDNAKTIEHPCFQSIIKKLNQPSQDAWKALLDSANGKITDTQIGKFLLFIRNQIIYHYEPKPIYLGYKQFFTSNVMAADRAYISRGTNMAKTRYYFADAAVQGCFERYKEGYQGADIFIDSISILGKLNIALMDIVNNFIIKRRFPFRTVHEEI